MTDMMMSPSPGSGPRVGVSCHTIWYLTVMGGVRVVRDWRLVRDDMLRVSYGRVGMEIRQDQIGMDRGFVEEADLVGQKGYALLWVFWEQ